LNSTSPTKLGNRIFYLLGAAVFCFIFMPRLQSSGQRNELYAIGWPVPLGVLKATHYHTAQLDWASPHYNQNSVVNAAIWLGVFFVVALLLAKVPALAKFFYAAIFLMAGVGAIWFILGVVQLVRVFMPSI
jgi:hypothetical protein